MHCVQAIRSWVLEWGPYALPALANGVLVFLGVWLSLPDFAQKVQDNPTYRKLLAALCIALGLVGFIADVRARHDSDKSSRQLIEKVGTALGKTNELLTKTDLLMTNTNTLVTFTTLALPQLAELKATVAGLQEKITTAKQQHDPQRVAALEAKAQETQQQADRISKILQALGWVPILVQQLRDWLPRLRMTMEDLNGNETSELKQYVTAHPQDQAEGIDRINQKWRIEESKANEQADNDLKALMANAEFVRNELLKWVPPQFQNAFDKTMEQQFAQAQRDLRGVDPIRDAAYLEDLTKRVRPPVQKPLVISTPNNN